MDVTNLLRGDLSMKIRVKLSALAVALLFAIGLVPFTSSQSVSAATCTSYTYNRGATGTCVKYIQTILNGISLDGVTSCLLSGTWQNGVVATDTTNQLVVDGSFGPLTKDRVYTFQKSHCIKYDGSVGPQTWGKLCHEGSMAGYNLSGPGWYDSSDWKDVKILAAYKASVWAGCNNNSWPYLFNY